MPITLVKLYIYQVCRALAYIHSTGICHRDIKPQNLLLDPRSHVVKLCDFGSAKVLQRNEPNVSYICSRYYRAPELIFGATDYTTPSIYGRWDACAPSCFGQPLFPGESGVDQLVEIIKVLGTPQREEIEAMNPNYTEFQFPQIKAHSWNKIFRSRTPPEAIDLLSKMLVYDPKKRLKPLEAAAHPFFDELRQESLALPNDVSSAPLFNFSMQGTFILLYHLFMRTVLIDPLSYPAQSCLKLMSVSARYWCRPRAGLVELPVGADGKWPESSSSSASSNGAKCRRDPSLAELNDTVYTKQGAT
ncbi:hypothetical protein PINS_up022103 [Pythium insidiosum]|nr:hypothetical protein PINS_up022103 [Pythium insidiosum]